MPIEIERKFLLAAAPDWNHPLLRSATVIGFEQIYLKADGAEEERIRRSRRDGVDSYHYAHLRPLSKGTREVIEKEIDAREYERLRLQRDPARQIIVKDRHCFTWQGRSFELDDIQQPVTRRCLLLEVELDRLAEEVPLPDFLRYEREVTGETPYSNATIALG
ncbi:hypothetical protein GCM10023195_52390 [Actinoallomurus liliacearum]|uniref:CYTH domain-containing protein n=1 Tax=Actinoallomurus liliacearum TaxID=1080073 RepID=A0ABP8TN81_9ACTN